MECIITFYLDKRRIKRQGKYPIKLRVFDKKSIKTKFYPIDIDLTEDNFKSIWTSAGNKSLRGTNKEVRLKLQEIEARANKEAEQMDVFSFDVFERKLFRKSSEKRSVEHHFKTIIETNISNNKIGTAESYKYTLNSLAEFSIKKKKTPINKLTFRAINVDWLNSYESFMLSKGKSYTTISIYTRTLRVVFNQAIRLKDISNDVYPFGLKKDNKYKIPSAKKVKKALTSIQLKTLFNAKVESENEKKAKAFWFFSYACNGMNLKDIALLKYSDIQKDKFEYYRAKTFDKSSEKTTITIYLTDFTKGIISDYGVKRKKGYVFDILNIDDDSITQYKKIKNFTRLINVNIKRIAEANNLPSDISTYWARHSFATNSVRKGASMEFVSEALNHSDLSVTKSYFAGFEDEAKKDFADKLLDF